jgi:hypothetical protein
MAIVQTRTAATEAASKGQLLPEYWRMISLRARSFAAGSTNSETVPYLGVFRTVVHSMLGKLREFSALC